MSEELDRVNIETNAYYSTLRDKTKQEEYIEQASEKSYSLMSLLDSEQFDLSDAEAQRILNTITRMYESLLRRVHDEG